MEVNQETSKTGRWSTTGNRRCLAETTDTMINKGQDELEKEETTEEKEDKTHHPSKNTNVCDRE